jgi:hypothetical protein
MIGKHLLAPAAFEAESPNRFAKRLAFMACHFPSIALC